MLAVCKGLLVLLVSVRKKRLAVSFVASAALVVVLAAPGQAATSALQPSVTVDQPVLTIDRTPGHYPAPRYYLTYALRLQNTGSDAVAGAEVLDRLPASLQLIRLPSGARASGQEVRFAITTLPAGGSWSATITTELVGDVREVSNAIQVTAAGQTVSSDPAVTHVQQLSAIQQTPSTTTTTPAPPATTPTTVPTAVLATTLQRPAPASVVAPATAPAAVAVRARVGPAASTGVAELPRTGSPVVPLLVVGLGLLVAGAALVRVGEPRISAR